MTAVAVKAIIWDASSGQSVLTLSSHEVGVRDSAFRRSQIQSVAFSPGGQLLATGSEDNTAIIWAVRAEYPG